MINAIEEILDKLLSHIINYKDIIFTLSDCDIIRMDSPTNIRRVAIRLRMLQIIYQLLKDNKYSTTREIYYKDVSLFRNQQLVNNIIMELAINLNVPRDSFNIFGSSKGLVFGNIDILNVKNEWISIQTETAICIPNLIKSIKTKVKNVIIIEKEAIFNHIRQEYGKMSEIIGDFIMITGKGYPCLATRRLLSFIRSYDENIKMFIFVDYDPHGIEIVYQYRIGSSKSKQERQQLKLEMLNYMGLKGDSLRGDLMPLLERDNKVISRLLKLFNKDEHQKDLLKELITMQANQQKAELESLGENLANHMINCIKNN